MQTISKTYKFIGKVLSDGHLSIPAEVAENAGKEFEVTMKPVGEITRAISLYLEGKTEKRGRIEDIVLPSDSVEEAIKNTFGTTNIDDIIDTVRR